MADDAAGNDIGAVFIPITGAVALAPLGTTLPTATEGNTYGYVLPVAFKRLGLVKVDGGPQLAWGGTGDPIEFWQSGYSIPSGLADVTLTVTAAETDAFTRELAYGVAPDANNMIIVDGGGHAVEKVLWVEEIAKDGRIRRRCAGKVGVRTVAEDKSERGSVLGEQFVFEIKRFSGYSNKHYAEWLLPAP